MLAAVAQVLRMFFPSRDVPENETLATVRQKDMDRERTLAIRWIAPQRANDRRRAAAEDAASGMAGENPRRSGAKDCRWLAAAGSDRARSPRSCVRRRISYLRSCAGEARFETPSD